VDLEGLDGALTDAAETLPGTDPDRSCFTAALETTRQQVITAQTITPGPSWPRSCPTAEQVTSSGVVYETISA